MSRLKSTDKKGNGAGEHSDPRKIHALKTAVDSGKYRVESRKVADKIVKDTVREIRNRIKD